MKKRLIYWSSGMAAAACATSAWASTYTDTVLSLNPNEYLQLQDTLGIGVDSSSGAPHPLLTVEGGIHRGIAGPGASDGFAGFGAGNLGWGFPENDNVGAQTDSEVNGFPQPQDGYLPVTGSGARTVISWFQITQPAGIEGSSQNAPNSRGSAIGFLQYGRPQSGSALDKEFRLGVAAEQDSQGNQTGRNLFNLNVGARSVSGTTTPIALSTWYMAAVVIPDNNQNSGDAQLYVNGMVQNLSGNTNEVLNTGNGTSPVSVRIGRDFGGYGIGGSMSQVTVWEHALSYADILKVYLASGGTLARPTWATDGDGNWSDSANWLSGVPNAAGAIADLTESITAPHQVTIDSPKTVGQLRFYDANSYTVAGTSTLTISNTAGNGSISDGYGSHTISAPVSLAGNTDVSVLRAADTLTFTSALTVGSGVTLTKSGSGSLQVKNIRLDTLTVSGGAVVIAPDGTNAATSKVNGVAIAGTTDHWSARLDLGNNSMIIGYPTGGPSPLSAVANQIKAGFAAGSWNGNGITSSSALAAIGNAHPTALGYGEASTLGISTFGGQPVDNNSAVLVRYTLAGDANLDGVVNALDFNALASSYGATGAIWTQADSNYDGTVDSSDFTLLSQNFGATLPASAIALASVVPEPVGLTLVGSVGLLALRRRRRD